MYIMSLDIKGGDQRWRSNLLNLPKSKFRPNQVKPY